MTTDQDLILYFYTFSPYARKVTAYLNLRGIPYTECQQPFTMPRPDLAAINVKYRRIPVLSIGRDIYCDTALILDKLEQFFPDSHMGGKTGTDKALITLLQKWTDLDVFPRVVETIPSDFEALQNPGFVKDREELWGRSWSKDRQDRMRAEALQCMKDNFEFLETIMSDEGKKWVLNSHGPSLADINAIWAFDWLLEIIPGGLPDDFFSSKQYPKTFAWRDRYSEAVKKAAAELGERPVIQGPEAAKRISGSKFRESLVHVDERDFTGVKEGSKVESWPIDDHSGRKNHESGELVGLNHQEVVIQKKIPHEETTIRVHLPRWNYRIESADARNGEADHHPPTTAQGGDEGLGAEHYEERH